MQTLASLVHERARLSPDDIALRSRVDGRWHDQTWDELRLRVDTIAAGLLTCPVPVRPGHTVGLLAETSREWIACDFAALSIGARTVPMYASLLAPEIGFVHVDTGIRVAIVDNAAQYAKIRSISEGFTFLDEEYPAEHIALGHVVVIDPTGLTPAPDWESLADLEARGRDVLEGLAPELSERRRAARPEELATFTYTSGTTGRPKAVTQTSHNHLAVVHAVGETGLLDDHMRSAGLFLFLPLAHSFGRLIQFAAPVHNLPIVLSSVPAVARDLQESRPGFLPAAPRVYEKLKAGVEQAMAEGSPLRRRVATWGLAVGSEVAAASLAGRAVPRWTRARWAVADALVLSKVRAGLGLDRCSGMLSGAAPLQVEVLEFFWSLGLPLYEAYGLTETSPGLTANRPRNVRRGSVGQALPGVLLRVAADGEIQAKGANITSGYHRRTEETRSIFDEDGWFRTGDEGSLDADGYLFITGRKKELIKTSGGKYVAPAKIEGALKLSPLVQEAVVVGDGRQFCTALIALDDEAVKAWRDRNAPAAQGDDGIKREVDAHVARVNAGLASFETVKYWTAIDPPTIASGELTASLKVKRHKVVSRWAEEIEAMYRT